MVIDSGILAERARLRYVSDGEPGIIRRRRGKGFSFAAADGSAIGESERLRISALVIPPAWTEVWICDDERGHLQATGRDAAGRKQYIYHPDWDEVRDEAKFDRLGPFGRALPKLRARIQQDLGQRGLPHRKVVALATAVLDQTLIRVGNKCYTQNGALGLTTLGTENAEIDGNVIKLSFTGKGGVDHVVALEDARLAALMSRCQDLSGQHLFSYTADDEVAAVTSNDVNEYLRSITGDEFSAKDFRTWGASALATAHLGQSGRAGGATDDQVILAAVDVAAEALGNTRAVCRASYIHPVIADAYVSGDLHRAWTQSRSGRLMKRPERALSRLLTGAA
jgi:DNA topoisomerase I